MIRRYARFVAFLVVGAIVMAVAMRFTGWAPALLIGFDAGAIVFFATLVSLFRGATAATMRQRSQANEPDHSALLLLPMGVAIVTIAGVWTELVALSGAETGAHRAMVVLALVSLVLVWMFTNTLAAIHYAHLWYLRGDGGADARGLDFPGPDLEPDYLDFTYFAAVLSMTFQVSDVAVTSKHMRRMALGHGLVAFLFNFSVIALSVNLATGVLGR